MITTKDLETTFKEIFEAERGLVQSIETVFELSKDKSFYKLVISIHGLSIEDTLIIHTKFIFKTNLEKNKLIENSFIYLYDINCEYHKVDFRNIIDLRKKIEDIIESNEFGTDLQILSDFIEAPSMFLNYYLKRARITNYSIYDVKYDPKFKTLPCSQITFDFKINVNNAYDISVSIQKKEKEEVDDIVRYKFRFQFLDKIFNREADTLTNIHFFIGSNIAKTLDKMIK
jgi:hypothetical protein